VDRRELQELARVRLKGAAALLRLGLFDGAYYLAGYAVECGLKACIAKRTRRYEFPDKKRVDSSYSHKLNELIRVAGLEDARAQQVAMDPDFRKRWEVVERWSEESRYRRHLPEAAETMLAAVGNRHHGVFSWIMLHW
jgi:hypothetical protein